MQEFKILKIEKISSSDSSIWLVIRLAKKCKWSRKKNIVLKFEKNSQTQNVRAAKIEWLEVAKMRGDWYMYFLLFDWSMLPKFSNVDYITFCHSWIWNIAILDGEIFSQNKKKHPYCDWLLYKGMHIWVFSTDKRTDVWSWPSCIYTQIFSPKKNWFFPHKK